MLFFVASSMVSGVISTVAFSLTEPLAATMRETAAAVASSGMSAMTYTSSPKA